MGETEGGIEGRFEAYVAALTSVFGQADRALPLHDYCSGLLPPGARKSVEPMAALVAPARVSAKHQSLLHFVGQANWSDVAVLAKVRDLVLPWLEPSGGVEAWVIDDTGFAKKVGLAHFEGRGWRGFHHHASLTIAAYGFLIRERAAFPPSGAQIRQMPSIPHRQRPRGASDTARATRPKLHRHNP